MGRRIYALCFEQTACEPTGPTEIVLFDKLQSLRGGSLQVGEGRVMTYLCAPLIDDDDALQHCSDVWISEESIDVADEQRRTVERAKAGNESSRPRCHWACRPFRPMHHERRRAGFYLEEQQAEVARDRLRIRYLEAQLSILAGEGAFVQQTLIAFGEAPVKP